MGASEFSTTVKAPTAREAFQLAREYALIDLRCNRDEDDDDDGSCGYTGTIIEKRDFIMVVAKRGETVRETVDRCMSDQSHACFDKWGPAACIAVAPGEWLFFGFASS